MTDTLDLTAATQKLLSVFRGGSHASRPAGQVLRAVHAKEGMIDMDALFSFDRENREIALWLIKMALENRMDGLPLSDQDRKLLWPEAA